MAIQKLLVAHDSHVDRVPTNDFSVVLSGSDYHQERLGRGHFTEHLRE